MLLTLLAATITYPVGISFITGSLIGASHNLAPKDIAVAKTT